MANDRRRRRAGQPSVRHEVKSRPLSPARRTATSHIKSPGTIEPSKRMPSETSTGAMPHSMVGPGYGCPIPPTQDASAGPRTGGNDNSDDPTVVDGERPVPDPAFESQLDNEFRGQAGRGEVDSGSDVTKWEQCNVTTLSMQLQTVAGSKEAVRTAVCDLLEKRFGQTLRAGDRVGLTQVEDLLLRRFFLPDWADGTKWKDVAYAGKHPFTKAWWDWASGESGIAQMWSKKYHQIAYCLLYVAIECNEYLGGIIDHAKKDDGDHCLTPQYFQNTVRPVIDGGGSVMIGTRLTGGHVVLVARVLDSGIIVNDPYGCALKKGVENYLLNGHTRKAAMERLSRVDPGRVLLAKRTQFHPELALYLDQGRIDDLPSNMGEGIFFDWAEVKNWAIGKWNNRVIRSTGK
jgi:hypothetical protein